MYLESEDVGYRRRVSLDRRLGRRGPFCLICWRCVREREKCDSCLVCIQKFELKKKTSCVQTYCRVRLGSRRRVKLSRFGGSQKHPRASPPFPHPVISTKQQCHGLLYGHSPPSPPLKSQRMKNQSSKTYPKVATGIIPSPPSIGNIIRSPL